MGFFELLQTHGGLSVLHLVQTVLFGVMLYILTTEYLRTLQSDLVYKLVATFSITILSIINCALHYLIQFENLKTSDSYLPLIQNSVFVIIVLALARAFVYDFLNQKNKKKFDSIFTLNIIAIIIGYFVLQYFWLQNFKEGIKFHQSWFQFSFSIYFIALLSLLVYITIKFRKNYPHRIAIAFLAIMIVQTINLIHFLFTDIGPTWNVIQALAPLLIPSMFGSVVFKDLIASNTKMLFDLKSSFQIQKGVIYDIDQICIEMNQLSTKITQKSTSSWSRLLDMKSLAEEGKNTAILLEKIRHQSKEIEDTAAQADALNYLIEHVQKKNRDLSRIAENISYVNRA